MMIDEKIKFFLDLPLRELFKINAMTGINLVLIVLFFEKSLYTIKRGSVKC